MKLAAGHYAPLSAGVKNQWTIDEQHYLLRNHKEMCIEDIAEALGRTTAAARCKAGHMGCSIKSRPTNEVTSFNNLTRINRPPIQL